MLIKPDFRGYTTSRGFLVLDGVNGAGKSTLQKQIMAWLAEQQLPALATREPGATTLGQALRPLILANGEPLSERAELFLFAADRAEHVAKLILPALAQGLVVVSDRYYYSTNAFQGFGRRLDLSAVSTINSFAIAGLLPDLTIILDLDPQEGLQRTRRRDRDAGAAAEKDCFEAEELDFHHRLRQGFLSMARDYPEPFLVVAAAAPREHVWEQVHLSLENWRSAFLEKRLR